MMENMNKCESCYFEKMNKTDRCLAKLTKKIKGKHNNIINENRMFYKSYE